jgi:2-oxo-4-hydroxy-4-carboxy-5-ureidoimidazoline decarboxylase
VQIEEFNALGPAAAGDALRSCVAIDGFVDTLVAARPYADLDELLAAAAAHAEHWTPDQVEGALADHPRIGARPTTGDEQARREQSGVGDDADLHRRLRDGNRRYEERFGRIYLVRAAGRTGEQMLALLEERLTNDPATELRVTAEQLAEITLLRLEGLFTP